MVTQVYSSGLYVHTAWATSLDGKTDFSLTAFEDATYVGTYTDSNSTDTNAPTLYNWTAVDPETATAAQAATQTRPSTENRTQLEAQQIQQDAIEQNTGVEEQGEVTLTNRGPSLPLTVRAAMTKVDSVEVWAGPKSGMIGNLGTEGDNEVIFGTDYVQGVFTSSGTYALTPESASYDTQSGTVTVDMETGTVTLTDITIDNYTGEPIVVAAFCTGTTLKLQPLGNLAVGGVPIVDIVYPVGSIYLSVNSTAPNLIYGGVWEKIQGRFLVGEGSNSATGHEALNLTAGATGGGAETTLQRSDLPNVSITTNSYTHEHTVPVGVNGAAGTVRSVIVSNQQTRTTSSDTHSHTFDLNGGVTQTDIDTLPPFLAVYMWKRIA